MPIVSAHFRSQYAANSLKTVLLKRVPLIYGEPCSPLFGWTAILELRSLILVDYMKQESLLPQTEGATSAQL